MPKFNVVIQLPGRGGTEYYAFSGKEFVIFKNVIDGEDRIIDGPHSIREHCVTLKGTKWESVDAVTPVSKSKPNEYYFFHEDKYIQAKLNEDLSNNNSVDIKDVSSLFGKLKEKGFYPVSAGYTDTQSSDRAVLFSGTRFGTYDTYYPKFTLEPCNIQDNWDSLKRVGFDHVDAVFPSSDGNLWYFFCGSRFARLKLSRGHEFDGNRSKSTLESGDWSISGSFTSFRNWPL